MAKKMNIEIGLNVKFFKDGDYYVAYSPELQISTYAKSVDEVKERFTERITIFFERALESGDIHERLTNLGWKFVGKPYKAILPPEDVTVPLELLAAQQCEGEKISYAL